MQFVGARANVAQVGRITSATFQSGLPRKRISLKSDHLHLPLRGEVHLLERRPLLCADAVHVQAEPDVRPRLCGGLRMPGAESAPSAMAAAPMVFRNERRSGVTEASFDIGKHLSGNGQQNLSDPLAPAHDPKRHQRECRDGGRNGDQRIHRRRRPPKPSRTPPSSDPTIEPPRPMPFAQATPVARYAVG